MKQQYQKIREYSSKHEFLILTILTILFELVIYMPSVYDIFFIYVSFIIYLVIIILLLFDKKNYKKNIFYLIFAIGVLIRTSYIYNTDIFTRQHDVGTLNNDGHLRYIYILFSEHHLPLTNNWQFYHPPFWHIIGSIWLWINNILGFSLEKSLEGLQIITLLLSSFSVLLVKVICERLKMKENYTLLTIAFIAIHPTMILLSGSINNDMLMTFLEIMIIILLFDWYKEPTIKRTIILAITTGLCVMTKMNGALMAIPILYVFIKKIIEIYSNTTIKKKRKEIKDYLKKIVIFGVISLPIGLWFSIRNMIRFDNYHAILNAGDSLYTGYYSIFSRLFTINFHELFNFVDIFHDHNLPAYLVKSSLFGEYAWDNIGFLRIISISLACLLIITTIVFMIRYIIKDRKNILMNILLIIFITSIISMYVFYWLYPNACSMDFRYIVITLVPSIIFITFSLDKIKNKIIKVSIWILISLFIACSFII